MAVPDDLLMPDERRISRDRQANFFCQLAAQCS
jgi:hypothetical protein